MNRLDAKFQELRQSQRKAFIPFLPAGDPDLAFTPQALAAVQAAGADIIEVGFPFSDPIADGPVIQASYTRALNAGLKLPELFQTLSAIPKPVPVVGMVSYTLIFKMGAVEFIRTALAAGLSGVVVPDLPVEEATDFLEAARAAEFHVILLVTPTTSDRRAAQIVAACRGFVYVVSVVGITGGRSAVADALRPMLARLRNLTDLPLCLGFGVSTPQHVADLRELADGLIVGSALVRTLSTAKSDRSAALTQLQTLATTLAAAVHA
ncbi:MAG: tryptophan synthase subunit alpha [Gemmataceae bacterium]